jgi:hypothetical protein
MEQMYIAYVLGIATVLLIGMVVGVVRANKMVTRHEKDFNEVDKKMNSMHEELCRGLDEFRRQIYDSALPEVDKRMGELNSYIDSRLDKLQSKLKTEKQ